MSMLAESAMMLYQNEEVGLSPRASSSQGSCMSFVRVSYEISEVGDCWGLSSRAVEMKVRQSVSQYSVAKTQGLLADQHA
jgi:hypothetical protein